MFNRDFQGKVQTSQLNFVELAGSELKLSSQEIQNSKSQARQTITHNFNCLSSFLVKTALNKRNVFTEAENVLVCCLQPGLGPQAQVLLLSFMSPNVAHYTKTVQAVK